VAGFAPGPRAFRPSNPAGHSRVRIFRPGPAASQARKLPVDRGRAGADNSSPHRGRSGEGREGVGGGVANI